MLNLPVAARIWGWSVLFCTQSFLGRSRDSRSSFFKIEPLLNFCVFFLKLSSSCHVHLVQGHHHTNLTPLHNDEPFNASERITEQSFGTSNAEMHKASGWILMSWSAWQLRRREWNTSREDISLEGVSCQSKCWRDQPVEWYSYLLSGRCRRNSSSICPTILDSIKS